MSLFKEVDKALGFVGRVTGTYKDVVEAKKDGEATFTGLQPRQGPIVPSASAPTTEPAKEENVILKLAKDSRVQMATAGSLLGFLAWKFTRKKK